MGLCNSHDEGQCCSCSNHSMEMHTKTSVCIATELLKKLFRTRFEDDLSLTLAYKHAIKLGKILQHSVFALECQFRGLLSHHDKVFFTLSPVPVIDIVFLLGLHYKMILKVFDKMELLSPALKNHREVSGLAFAGRRDGSAQGQSLQMVAGKKKNGPA